MTQGEREKSYKLFVDTWGVDAQMMMCVEEMSELTKAICKYSRFDKENASDEIKYNLLEEIADVINMAEQMRFIFGKEKIDAIRDAKIERCINTINEK